MSQSWRVVGMVLKWTTISERQCLRISMVEDQVVNLGDVGSSPIVSAL